MLAVRKWIRSVRRWERDVSVSEGGVTRFGEDIFRKTSSVFQEWAKWASDAATSKWGVLGNSAQRSSQEIRTFLFFSDTANPLHIKRDGVGWNSPTRIVRLWSVRQLLALNAANVGIVPVMACIYSSRIELINSPAVPQGKLSSTSSRVEIMFCGKYLAISSTMQYSIALNCNLHVVTTAHYMVRSSDYRTSRALSLHRLETSMVLCSLLTPAQCLSSCRFDIIARYGTGFLFQACHLFRYAASISACLNKLDPRTVPVQYSVVLDAMLYCTVLYFQISVHLNLVSVQENSISIVGSCNRCHPSGFSRKPNSVVLQISIVTASFSFIHWASGLVSENKPIPHIINTAPSSNLIHYDTMSFEWATHQTNSGCGIKLRI